MDKYQRRQFFESLCSLRAAYLVRGADDRLSVISITDVIRDAEELMASLPALEVDVVDGTAAIRNEAS